MMVQQLRHQSSTNYQPITNVGHFFQLIIIHLSMISLLTRISSLDIWYEFYLFIFFNLNIYLVAHFTLSILRFYILRSFMVLRISMLFRCIIKILFYFFFASFLISKSKSRSRIQSPVGLQYSQNS